jgi:hypothetical protein
MKAILRGESNKSVSVPQSVIASKKPLFLDRGTLDIIIEKEQPTFDFKRRLIDVGNAGAGKNVVAKAVIAQEKREPKTGGLEKLDYSINMLESVMKPFIGKDELRPNMMGINIQSLYGEGHYAIATDTNKVMVLPISENIKNGFYNVEKNFWGNYRLNKSNETFPNVGHVISSKDVISSIGEFDLSTIDGLIKKSKAFRKEYKFIGESTERKQEFSSKNGIPFSEFYNTSLSIYITDRVQVQTDQIKGIVMSLKRLGVKKVHLFINKKVNAIMITTNDSGVPNMKGAYCMLMGVVYDVSVGSDREVLRKFSIKKGLALIGKDIKVEEAVKQPIKKEGYTLPENIQKIFDEKGLDRRFEKMFEGITLAFEDGKNRGASLDYPYGRLRTRMDFYTEFNFTTTKKGVNNYKGFRSARQTINPKTGRINKPKFSTYHDFIATTVDDKGHYSFVASDFSGEDSIIRFRALLPYLKKQGFVFTNEMSQSLWISMIGTLRVSASWSGDPKAFLELVSFKKLIKKFGQGASIYDLYDIPMLDSKTIDKFITKAEVTFRVKQY